MKKIFKYLLEIIEEQIKLIPKNGEILTVQTQNDEVYLWALIDPNMDYEDRKIRIIGTGHPIDDWEKLQYIGTTQQMNGQLIWHVFEEIQPNDYFRMMTKKLPPFG